MTARAEIVSEIERLTAESRSALSFLYQAGGSDWTYGRIAEFLNGITNRQMDASYARRFVLADPKGAKFSPAEIVRIHMQSAAEERNLRFKLTGISAPELKLAFNPEAKGVSLTIPLEAIQTSVLENSPELQEYIVKSVRDVITLYCDARKAPEPE